MQQRLTTLAVILGYIVRELGSLTVYVTAAIVGGAINYFQGTFALSPFIIPVVVQSVARGMVKYNKRLDSQLAVLPAMRPDPTFIMDSDGRILLAAGRTRELFDRHGVAALGDILDERGRDALLAAMAQCQPISAPMHVRSALLDRHFEAVLVPVADSCAGVKPGFMCWFKDITTRERLQARQQSLMEFANGLLEGAGEITCAGDMDKLLAAHILETHAAVFIARQTTQGGVSGQVYRRPPQTGSVEASDSIEIAADSDAPILLSARADEVVFDAAAAYGSVENFERAYPFARPVREFVGAPITGFANCQKGTVAVIAFNPDEPFSPSDTLYFETLINVSRSIETLLNARRENADATDIKETSHD